MGIIKDVRSVTLPDGNLAWKDIQSQIRIVQTGKFTRNCVLSGKASADMSVPLFIRTPGVIDTNYIFAPESLGHIDASEGSPKNALPVSDALTATSTYWNATALGAWIAYHHIERPTMIRGYRFITENGYTPRVWRVEGSNDNVTWTTLHSVTVDWTWGDGRQVVEQTIPEENRDYFAHHRLIIDEFDASEVRVYYIQFWDAFCPTVTDIYLDATSSDPLQIAFADGYNQDGTPKDIVKTITTPSNISLDTFLAEVIDPVNHPFPHACVLFAEYDAGSDEVTFIARSQYNELPLPSSKYKVLLNEWGGDVNNIFDYSSSTYLSSSSVYADLILELTQPDYYSWCFRWTGVYQTKLYISEDYGATWVGGWSMPSTNAKFFFDRPYYVTRLKFIPTKNHYSHYIYYFGLPSKISSLHKLTDGKVYEYDSETDTWSQVYRVPLGTMYLVRTPDGTAVEVGDFIPTNMPQMTYAPYITKTAVDQ